MGRRKMVGLLVICGLTLLNIWMAKYVIKPLKNAQRFQKDVKPKERKLSDILVVSIDDVHPIQHLQEAALMDAKRETTTDPPRASSTYSPWMHTSGYDNSNTEIPTHLQAGSHVTVFTNKKPLGPLYALSGNYGNNVPVYKQGNNLASADIIRNNNNINTKVYPENNRYMYVTENNKRDVTSPNSVHDISNRDAHNNDMTVYKRLSDMPSDQVRESESSHLSSLETAQLVNIKQSLEALKYLLGKLSPVSRRTAMQHLMNSEINSHFQPATQSRVFPSDNFVQTGPSDGRDVQKTMQISGVGDSILDFLKGSIKPPIMAAPALPQGSDTSLLNKLLTETNMDNLNVIVNENTGAVMDLLSMMLTNLQQRESQIHSRPQQQVQHQLQELTPIMNYQQTDGSTHTSQASDIHASSDHNNYNIIHEMIKNIAKNNVDTNSKDWKSVENFLRDIQMGHP